MVYKTVLAVSRPILFFVTGACCVFAVQERFFACALVLILIAVWGGASIILDQPSPAPQSLVKPADAAETQWRLVMSSLDRLPTPLLLLSPDGLLRAINRAARGLFKTDDRIISPPVALIAALEAKPLVSRLTVNLSAQGETRTFAMSAVDLVGVETPRRLIMLLDIQPEIRVAEATALRDMMQVLSHEIMNALTPVSSLAATALELLSDDTPSSTAIARDAVETLAKRAEGLARFVEAYRSLARLPPPVVRPTSISAVLEETAQIFRSRWSKAEAELIVTDPDPDVMLGLDLDLIVHALMNVLSNAVDSARQSSKRAKVSITAECRGEGIVLAVTDNGPGVGSSERDRIFQPFFTTKTEGTGVGLSFARQVALSHGGELSLAPQRHGDGATFELSLLGGQLEAAYAERLVISAGLATS